LSVTAALTIALLLDKFLQSMPYVSLFLCAIMFVAWFGGIGPSLLAVALAALYFTYFLVDPVGSFEVAATEIPRLALFVITSLFVVALSAAQRRNSQELARVNQAVLAENTVRKRVEAYLDEAQALSRTGSFGWKIASGEVFWSKEAYRVLDIDRGEKATVDLLLQRVHPDDRPILQAELGKGQRDFDYELRWLTPAGSTKHLHIRAHRMRFDSGDEEIVGAVM